MASTSRSTATSCSAPGVPKNGTTPTGEMTTCFVCNEFFHNNSSVAQFPCPAELDDILIVLCNAFGISSKRRPEPFKKNPFCKNCGKKARELQSLALELETLEEKIDRVRKDMASAIVSTYVYCSKEIPNFELKHLIFERWYDKVDDCNAVQSLLKVKKEKQVKVKSSLSEDSKADEKAAKKSTGAAAKSSKRSELEIARLIQQNDERLSCDPNNDGSEEALCLICSKVCRNKELLEIHMKTHGGGGERPFSCEFCGRSFFGKAILKKHLELKHKHESAQGVCAGKSVGSSSASPGDKDVTDDASPSPPPVKKPPLKRKMPECKVCGKPQPNRKAMSRHIAKFHKKKINKCSTCGKVCKGKCQIPKSSEASESYTSPTDGMTNPDQVKIPPKVVGSNNLTSDKKTEHSLKTDMEGVKEFKRRNSPFRNVNFNITVKLDRLVLESGQYSSPPSPSPSSSSFLDNSVVDEEEAEEGPSHILKSVAWKAKGAWFTQTQEKQAVAKPKPATSLSLHSNWKSFFQKTQKPPANRPPSKAKPSTGSTGSSTTTSSNTATMSTPTTKPKFPNATPNSTSYLPSPSVPTNPVEDLPQSVKIRVPLPKGLESERSSTPTSNSQGKDSMPASAQGFKRPMARASSPTNQPAKRPTDTSYWLDPNDLIPDTRKQPEKAKTKPGPMRKLSDITRALKLGMKRPGPKSATTPIPIKPRPASLQIAKVARELRKSGVGVSKGRFDPVFQLHPLGGPNRAGVSGSPPVPSALTLNRNVGSPKVFSRSSTTTKTNVWNPPEWSQLADKISPPSEIDLPAFETESICLPSDFDGDLMRNPNVTVFPTATVRNPAHAPLNIKSTMKRMAGPRSKTRVPKVTGTPQSGVTTSSTSSTPTPNPGIRFINVAELLGEVTPQIGAVYSQAPQFQRRNSESNPSAEMRNANLLEQAKAAAGFATGNSYPGHEPEVHELDSDSDGEDERPKIRIRNLESLAEPEEESEEDEEESESEVLVMEEEETETFTPGATEATPSTNSRSYPYSSQAAPTTRTPIPTPQRITINLNDNATISSARVGSIPISDPSMSQLLLENLTQTQPNPRSQSNPMMTVSGERSRRSPTPETFVYRVTETEDVVRVSNSNDVGSGRRPSITSQYSLPKDQVPVITNVYSQPPSHTLHYMAYPGVGSSNPGSPMGNTYGKQNQGVEGESEVTLDSLLGI